MMRAASSLRLPNEKKAVDNRAKLFNAIVHDLRNSELGWPLEQMQQGTSFVELITRIMWMVG